MQSVLRGLCNRVGGIGYQANGQFFKRSMSQGSSMSERAGKSVIASVILAANAGSLLWYMSPFEEREVEAGGNSTESKT